jgi:hypothetical protein
LLALMARFAFFALGGSNSFATVDLAGAYTGLLEYGAKTKKK